MFSSPGRANGIVQRPSSLRPSVNFFMKTFSFQEPMSQF